MFRYFSITKGDSEENKKVQDLLKFDELKLPRSQSFYTFNNSFSLVNETLGSGAESRDVRSFKNSITGEETAVKRVIFEDLDGEEGEKQALKDGQAEAVCNKLVHKTGEFYNTNHGFYILMKKLPTTTLSQLYFEGDHKINSYGEFLELFKSITSEVKGLHDKKVSHGDLHEKNILVDAKNSKSALCDFNKIKFKNNRGMADDVYEIGALITKFDTLNKLTALSTDEKEKLTKLAQAMCISENYESRISIAEAHQFFVEELEKINEQNYKPSFS